MALEKSTAERFKLPPIRGKLRRFTQFYDAAGSWSRVERIIARVEAGAESSDTRFIVTTLKAAAPSTFTSGSTVPAARPGVTPGPGGRVLGGTMGR